MACRAVRKSMERVMPQPNDLSHSLVAFEQNGTNLAVIEINLSSWLVARIAPGAERPALKEPAPFDRIHGPAVCCKRNRRTGHAIRVPAPEWSL